MSFLGSLGKIGKKALGVANVVAPFIPGVGLGVKAALTGANALLNRPKPQPTGGFAGGSPGALPGMPGAYANTIGQAPAVAQGWATAAGRDAGEGRNTLLALLHDGAPSADGARPVFGMNAADAAPAASARDLGDAAESRANFASLQRGGQQAFEQSFGGAMRAALPGFLGQLQSTRAGAIRRGITTGDLGTSYEGDVTSAFQRNAANAAASQATALYGQQLGAAQALAAQDAARVESAQARQQSTYAARLNAATNLYQTDTGREDSARNTWLDLLSGNADRAQAASNASAERTAGTWGAVLGAAGTLGGAYLGSRTGGSAGGNPLGGLTSGIAGLFGRHDTPAPAGALPGLALTPSYVAPPTFRATAAPVQVAPPSRYFRRTPVRKDGGA